MRVGLVIVRLRLQYPESLKEKRHIIKGLIAHLRHDFNISVAELDQLDDKRAATLGAAIISNDGRVNNRILSKVVSEISRRPGVMLEDQHLEIL